ncbi:MAG: undecaprenyl-diphosphatase, partial [Rickettsiales bacterium]
SSDLISAFISASFVIKWLIGFVQTRSLRIFGYYRIFVGILILLLLS